jgi:hypothetical protein
MLKTPKRRESLEILAPPPYRRGHQQNNEVMRWHFKRGSRTFLLTTKPESNHARATLAPWKTEQGTSVCPNVCPEGRRLPTPGFLPQGVIGINANVYSVLNGGAG